jgi:hypothetical protein
MMRRIQVGWGEAHFGEDLDNPRCLQVLKPSIAVKVEWRKDMLKL